MLRWLSVFIFLLVLDDLWLNKSCFRSLLKCVQLFVQVVARNLLSLLPNCIRLLHFILNEKTIFWGQRKYLILAIIPYSINCLHVLNFVNIQKAPRSYTLFSSQRIVRIYCLILDDLFSGLFLVYSVNIITLWVGRVTTSHTPHAQSCWNFLIFILAKKKRELLLTISCVSLIFSVTLHDYRGM